jgi:hypothetical protein
MHQEAAAQLVEYNAAMGTMLDARSVEDEHSELWRRETLRAIANYGRATLVADDLLSRFENRLDLAKKQLREAELDQGLAIDSLDPDANAYTVVIQRVSEQCNVLSSQVSELADLSHEIKSSAEPIANVLAAKSWGTAADTRDEMRSTRRRLRLSSTGAVTDTGVDSGEESDNDDPKFASTREAIKLRLRVQDRATDLKTADQESAEIQLTAIRAQRADASHAAEQHRMSQRQWRESMSNDEDRPRDNKAPNESGESEFSD